VVVVSLGSLWARKNRQILPAIWRIRGGSATPEAKSEVVRIPRVPFVAKHSYRVPPGVTGPNN
jgi:hypothetical protein